jgi:hypothetical protein
MISTVKIAIVSLSITTNALFVFESGFNTGESMASYISESNITTVIIISVALDCNIFAITTLNFIFSGKNPTERPYT